MVLAYMTGILPIAKYSSGSELNMFLEYTMASEEKYSRYFGFTHSELKMLFEKYLAIEKNPRVTLENLEEWYDGYQTLFGERIFNPRSVTAALTNNNTGNYWTSSGPYDEIFYYIRNNIDEVKNDIASMIAGEKVKCDAREYAVTSRELKTREEILSAMVVYGFLTSSDGYVEIPNKELMGQFSDMLLKEDKLGYIHRLAKESERLLNATLEGNAHTVESILEYVNDTESPILDYNNETELSAVVNLAYLSARDRFRVNREDKSGKGFVDFIFYPIKHNDRTGIILELKVDASAGDAIKQIEEKNYVQRFMGKIAEAKLADTVIEVGISYDKKTKKHECIIKTISL